MKVVNVVSQRQWDCVSKENNLDCSKGGDWNLHKEKTCINISKNAFASIEHYESRSVPTLTFDQWVLEHCKEKYKGNPIVKEYETSLPIEIKSNAIGQGVNYPSHILCDDIKGISRLLFDRGYFKFATIIEKSIEQQPHLLEIAKEKYPIGTKVKGLFSDEIKTVNSQIVNLGDIVKNSVHANGDIWFGENERSNVLVYDDITSQWAEIIPSEPEQWIPKVGEWVERVDIRTDLTKGKKYEVKETENNSIRIIDDRGILCWYSLPYFKPYSQSEQRVIMSVIAPENLYGGLIQKGEELIRMDSYRFVKTPIIDNVHPLFIPIEVTNDWEKIYEKTEAEVQSEILDEMQADWLSSKHSSLYDYLRNETKFKIVRNEN